MEYAGGVLGQQYAEYAAEVVRGQDTECDDVLRSRVVASVCTSHACAVDNDTPSAPVPLRKQALAVKIASRPLHGTGSFGPDSNSWVLACLAGDAS